MMTDNQRQEPRLARHDPIHIQIQHGSSAPPQPAVLLHADTRDISSNGFNARSNRPLQVGTLLDVLIELRGNGKPFLLTAEVRWSQPQANGEHAVGFAIVDAVGTDYQAWQQQF